MARQATSKTQAGTVLALSNSVMRKCAQIGVCMLLLLCVATDGRGVQVSFHAAFYTMWSLLLMIMSWIVHVCTALDQAHSNVVLFVSWAALSLDSLVEHACSKCACAVCRSQGLLKDWTFALEIFLPVLPLQTVLLQHCGYLLSRTHE